MAGQPERGAVHRPVKRLRSKAHAQADEIHLVRQNALAQIGDGEHHQQRGEDRPLERLGAGRQIRDSRLQKAGR